MSKNLIARVKRNLQVYKVAKDAWLAGKTGDIVTHDNYVNARDTVEMGAYEDESELLAAIESLQAENARLRAALRPFAEMYNQYDDEFVAEDDHEYSQNWFSVWMGKTGYKVAKEADYQQAAAALADDR